MYILQRDDGAYVAQRGSPHSYTRKLELAEIFPTLDAAQRNQCVENERIIALGERLKQTRF